MIDAGEYNDTVERWSDDLYRFALRYTADEATAKDVVQECFATLWERRSSLFADGIKGWLIRVMYHRLVDIHRHTARLRPADELESRPWQPQHDFELRDSLDYALQKLPELQRTLVLLHDLEGYSYAEMAHLTGLSAQQVGVYLLRARRSLKRMLNYEL